MAGRRLANKRERAVLRTVTFSDKRSDIAAEELIAVGHAPAPRHSLKEWANVS